MRYVYCHECSRVSTNVWTERDVCTNCGHPAERMRLRTPWQSYASSTILLIATGVLLLGPTMDWPPRLVIILAALATAYGLSSWSMRLARARILHEVELRNLAEHGKA